ncbi:MAG: Rieske 2Fe-2S domain-containing protein, partial [Geminicoccaceae bacterium]|nr:Rieske 2Fe-2S domain-containing protein [Geminicoccaceae bacterium]
MAERDHDAGALSALGVGTMREVDLGGTPVLLVRLEDGVWALAARCPHFGAPLSEGLLSDRRIVCPWH